MIANEVYPVQRGRAQWRGFAAPLVKLGRDGVGEPDRPQPTQSEPIDEAPLLLAGKPLHVPDRRLRR